MDVSEKLEESFLLDRLWCTLREEPQVTKESTLHLLIQILEETQVPYALVGGVAIQIYVPEPRTTLDIDIAVLAREAVPTSYLEARGFQKTGDFRFSQNWQGPDKTRVQFTLDEYAEQTIGSATLVDWQETKIRVVSRLELLRAKIRAATDKERRPSKRAHDIGDIRDLLELTPALHEELTGDERALCDRLLAALF